jgi:DNA replication protein DnaC
MRLGQNLAESALTMEADTHQEYLLKLLHAEIDNRERIRAEKLVKGAGFYSVKTFDGFLRDDIAFPSGVSIESLLTFDFVRDRMNLVLYGANGTGKTLMTTALGVAACRAGIPVKFFRTAALVNQLSEALAAGTLSKFMKKLMAAEIIALDEWGYVPYDQTGARLLYEVITEAYERKSIVLNTNLEFSKWATVLYDEKLTASILERILFHCHIFLFPGPSIRLRESTLSGMIADASMRKGGA